MADLDFKGAGIATVDGLDVALNVEREKYARVPIKRDLVPDYEVYQAWACVVARYFLLDESLKLLAHLHQGAALGLSVGPVEAEPFWTGFLHNLASRGLRGVKLVISDAHEGLRAAIARVLHATWQTKSRALPHRLRAGVLGGRQSTVTRRTSRHRNDPT